MTVLNGDDDKVIKLGADDAENITLVDPKAMPDYVLATSTEGSRIESQWEGFHARPVISISTVDGSRKLIKDKNVVSSAFHPKENM